MCHAHDSHSHLDHVLAVGLRVDSVMRVHRAQGRGLCPAALGHELAQLAGSVDVHITHIKPGELEAVMAEIGRLGAPHRIHTLAAGQAMDLSAT